MKIRGRVHRRRRGTTQGSPLPTDAPTVVLIHGFIVSNAFAVAVNFYSSGDEVLELAADNDVWLWTGIGDGLSHHSWHKQEMFKERGLSDGAGATTWSGWNVEEYFPGVRKISVVEARRMADDDFRTNTVFYCFPPSMNDPAITRPGCDAHLALGILALTPAAGSVKFGGDIMRSRMIDMNEDNEANIPRPNGWPSRSDYSGLWLHSDVKDVPYFYTYKLFEKMVEKGKLK